MFDVYIVNMAKDSVKRQHMEAVCDGRLGSYEFVDAVVGADLSSEELQSVYSERDALSKIGRGLSRGEIGCYLSHRKVYQLFLSSAAAAALVLEDDVQISNDIAGVVSKLMTISGWDIVFLGHHGRSSRNARTLSSLWGRVSLGNNIYLAKPCEKVMGTYGYVVSRQGAEKMVARTESADRPIDHLTGDYRSLNLYCVVNPVVTIDEPMSVGHHSMHERADLKAEKNYRLSSESRSFLARARGALVRGYRRCANTVRVILPL